MNNFWFLNYIDKLVYFNTSLYPYVNLFIPSLRIYLLSLKQYVDVLLLS